MADPTDPNEPDELVSQVATEPEVELVTQVGEADTLGATIDSDEVDEIVALLQSSDTIETTVADMMGLRGPPGPRGAAGSEGAPGGFVYKRARAPLSSGLVVRADGEDYARPASSLVVDDAFAIAGVSFESAAAPGAVFKVVRLGEMEDSDWSWRPLEPVYVGATGRLTQAIEPGWAFVRVVGFALTPTRIMVDFTAPLFKAR